MLYSLVRRFFCLAALAGTLTLVAADAPSFRDQQWKCPRVRVAASAKDKLLRPRFAQKGLAYPPKAILLRAFKKEAWLELWTQKPCSAEYVLVKTYSVGATSGVLGPKRKFGDEQVPEGFYELDLLQPARQFLFKFARQLSECGRQNPGVRSRIRVATSFLHGNCVTIGCLAITDDGIKEVYWLSVLARTSGQQHIPIQIFPARLTSKQLDVLAKGYRGQPELITFWTNLQKGYQYFAKYHQPAEIRIDRGGHYVFSRE